MIENAIRCGRIEAGESAKRSTPRRKENDVNNTSMYNKPVTMSQPKVVTTSHQGFARRDFNPRPNTERVQFTPIPMSYKELYQSLFDAHVVSPFYLKSMQPPFPKWYDANAQCEYHAGATGHSIENCTTFKKLVERLINMGIVKFDDTPSAENSLPNHGDKGINAIIESSGKEIKMNVAEVNTPLKEVWKKIVEKGLVTQNSGDRHQGAKSYCEFHNQEDHEIQKCSKFRALVQGLMDNKELEFFKYVRNPEGTDVCASKEGSTRNACKINHPLVIISSLRTNEDGTQVAPKVVIQKPVAFPYKDSKREPKLPKKGSQQLSKGKKRQSGLNRQSMSAESRMKPKILKILKHSEINVVEQLHKQLARISVLALLLSSETHRSALMKVLNETYVAHDISVNKLDCLVNNISVDNFIFFNDSEIPPGEEDIITSVTSNAPYVRTDDEAIECSFRSLEFVNATFVIEENKVPTPRLSKTTRMGLQLMVGKGALPGRRLGRSLQ
ncbi:uncharacterized protein LOC128285263 [Gossypium arboreum]|uniref:uncharacterized protein LOC128285263 n=1 Tax=Gossypium arboreum TaxID=29729 RepID=UPI0022F149BC|nr:uncharacterized protein LOC128285263 [Gossypium arboreum]